MRVPETGPLRLDADFDPEVLRHVSMLKLSEEEAEVLGDAEPRFRCRRCSSRTARAARR